MEHESSGIGRIDDDWGVSRRLVEWYNTNKRDLPWRHTQDPYIIWISEIILQQTRVAQGMDYFLRFVGRFPDVAALASADEDEVLKYWQGLGYYSRARNLHAAAKDIMNRFDGVFPSEYKDVLSLKGVGEYTAAAIVSSAWNMPYPVVDGNVYRVLSRLYGIETPIDSTAGKKEFTVLAGMIMHPVQARLHNQAIMELGALQCVPLSPDCANCPLVDKCAAYAMDKVRYYPVKSNKTKTRDRYFHYFHIIYEEETWLHRRIGKDIWTGLYEFPLIETDSALSFEELQQTGEFRRLFDGAAPLDITIERPKEKHVLSHQILYATFYRVKISRKSEALSTFLCIPENEIGQFAVPRLIHIYLEKLEGNLFR